MKNLWAELKAFKCQPWSEIKLFPCNNKSGRVVLPPQVIVDKPNISFETLPEEDRDIYGSHPKTDLFFLDRCRTCSRLLKPCIRDTHQASCTRVNGAALAKKNTCLPPSKKKKTKRSNKSTSGEDSESIISSENSSPALDSLEVQVSDSCATSVRDDSMIDVMAVEEIVSEDSKPPTPGPQDLYEEFATPFVEETSSSFSSALESSSSTKFKPTLKLKIISSNSNQRSHGTSLLEAHLLSNTKYNTSSGISNVITAKNIALKRAHPASLLEQAILKSEDDQSNTSKSISFAKKLKTDTKISIPISLLPQTVKMSPALVKKPSANSKNVLSKTNLQKLVNAKDRTVDPRPFNVVIEETNSAKASTAECAKGKTPARPRKNKRSKGRGRTTKTVEFDPDRHCGVLLDENRHCMRSLTCKTHSMSLRRSVEGRSKDFDRLLAEHRASRESLKDQDRLQSLNLSEPVISIPLLAVDNIAGSTIQIPAGKSNSEIVRVRVANLPSSSENQKLQMGGELLKGREDEKVLFKKSTAKISAMSALSAALSSKSPNATVHRVLSNGNLPTVFAVKPDGRKLQLYDNNLKISFVCSDMLYKVGGLLYTDRSRQAVRKCMVPLTTSNGVRLKVLPLKQVHSRRKITDFLNSVKNPPIKLSLAEKPNNVVFTSNLQNQNQLRSSEETSRMQNLLASSSKILGSLSTDENELRKLRITRVKKSADEGRVQGSTRVKLDSISDENYDINTLLSFDKSLLNKTSNDDSQFPIVTADDFVFRPGKEEAKFTNQPQSSVTTVQVPYNVPPAGSGVRVGIGSTNFQESDTQLWQTFQDMESEIINTVGVGNIQELYSTQPLSNDNAYPSGYLNADTVYQENDIVEETISKNYSLLEEYCKNITTDELLSDGKGNYGYYESSSTPLADGSEMKLSKNGASIINEHLYTNIGNQSTAVGNSISMPTDFDSQILTSYLTNVTSENGTPARNVNVNNMRFISSDQFNTMRLDTPSQAQILPQEHVYEEILTMNKPFQGQF